ncbi:MAG TPA: HRDC domain-containing protein [Anaerolineales bacterium]|nr:HRDC domain-containing protein [Anaerolineales bacterium]
MDLESLAPPVLVQAPEHFTKLIHELRRQTHIAVDTESNSLHAYRERVCLIQFSTLEKDYVLDPFAFGKLDPLGLIFSNPHIEKVFHASEYDIICLRRDYGFTFVNIFDTMLAGRILGRKQAGLDRLLEDKFGVKVNKRFQKADWGVRPLSPDLLLYARLDTHYLVPLRDLLKAELEEKGLWQLAQEDFSLACNPNGLKPKSESPHWARFSTRRDLTPRDLTILNELVAFREQMAAQLDRPPFKVLDDEKLIEIAKAVPTTMDQLSEIGLSARQMQHWGASILEAVERGVEGPPVKQQPPKRPRDAYLKRLDKLKDWRKKAAAEMNVESDVILPRSLLEALAERGPEGFPSVMKSSPWRMEHFGSQILNVLGGNHAA